MFSKEQKIGLSAEIWVARALDKLGYSVTMPPDFNAECHDLTVNESLCVEVKFSRQGVLTRQLKNRIAEYPRYQWNVESVSDKDCVLILIACDNDDIWHPFIMPSVVMADRTVFQINTHPKTYKGLISKFLGTWEVVEFMLSGNWAEKLDLTIGGLMSDGN